MKRGILLVVLSLLVTSAISHAREERWSNFAEDGDLRYYLDEKTIVPVTDSRYIFWVKSIAKDKGYFKREYNLNNLSYILTNYEVDCSYSTYRVRGTIMFDKSRREISKIVNEGPGVVFEPVPPESVVELVQEELCVAAEGADLPENGQPSSAPVVVEVPLRAMVESDPPSLQ